MNYTIGYRDDLDLNELKVGDTIEVTFGEVRADGPVSGFPIKYEIICGEIKEGSAEFVDLPNGYFK